MRLRSSPPNEGVLVPVNSSRTPSHLVAAVFNCEDAVSAPLNTFR